MEYVGDALLTWSMYQKPKSADIGARYSNSMMGRVVFASLGTIMLQVSADQSANYMRSTMVRNVYVQKVFIESMANVVFAVETNNMTSRISVALPFVIPIRSLMERSVCVRKLSI